MIITEKVFAYTYVKQDLTFLKITNFVNTISECDIIYIDGYSLINDISEQVIDVFLKIGKTVIIDHSYELIEHTILDKLSKLDNLSMVNYYCIPRQSDFHADLIDNLVQRGLNLFASQYFADFGHYYIPVLSKNLPYKDFTLLTGKTKPERTLLVTLLSYHDLIQDGYVSFFGEMATDSYFSNSKINELYTKSPLITNDSLKEKSLSGLAKLNLPLTLDEPILNAKISHAKNFNANYYLASNFVIVTETSMNNSSIFFVSEKTVKPILLNKKIIVLSHQHFIKNLKEYYRTKFNKDISHLTDWCNLAYDDEADTTTRIEMIVDEVKNQITKNKLGVTL